MYACGGEVHFFTYRAVYVHGFAVVDTYLAFGCTTSDDTPISMFQGKRLLNNFPGGEINIVISRIS